jgi:P27 family predicted phage terminase small subunit
MKKSLRAPQTLSPAAKRWWALIVNSYEISTNGDDPAGLLLLETAMRAFDEMEKAQAIVKRTGPMLRDRFGQAKLNPMVLVARDARMGMLRAIKQLNLDIAPGAPLGSGRD